MSDYSLFEEAKILGLGTIYCTTEMSYESLKYFRENSTELITLSQLAHARSIKGRNHRLCGYGSFVKEGALYIPKENKRLLLKESALLDYPIEATKDNAKNSHFCLFENEAMFYLERARKGNPAYFILEDTKPISSAELHKNEFGIWAFGYAAEEYGALLKRSGIKELQLEFYNSDYMNEQIQPFATQLLLGRIDTSTIHANHLSNHNYVRGLKPMIAKNLSKSYTIEDIDSALDTLDSVRRRYDLWDKLSGIVKLIEEVRDE